MAIAAVVEEFCKENFDEFKNRAFGIVEGKTTKEDMGKALVHVCYAHVAKMNLNDVKPIVDKKPKRCMKG